MLKFLLFSVFFWLVESSPISEPTETYDFECDVGEELLNQGSCDGDCNEPFPSCRHAKTSLPRCGCPNGFVRNVWNDCIKYYQCNLIGTTKLTQCLVEAKHSSTPNICDKDGNYKTVQTSEDGSSKCVVPETGSTIPGKTSTTPDIDCEEYTSCQKEWIVDVRFHFYNPDVMDGANIQCNRFSGHYKKRQCTSFTDYCYCVVPQTGDAIPGLSNIGSTFKCKDIPLTECQESFVRVSLLNMELDVKLSLPKCSEKDGSYKLEECNKHGYCQCISPITGEFLPGNGININCAELTSCQKQYLNGKNKTAMSCDDDGRFMTTQCNDESCYCVDADTGDVTSAKISTSDEFNLNCSMPKCPSNMKYTNCGGCESTCEHEPILMCNLMCHFRCACEFGLIWSTEKKTCVVSENCINMAPPPPFIK